MQVAQEGLSRCSVAGGSSEGGSVGGGAGSRTSGLGSYPEIHVPVYAAVKGVSDSKLPAVLI